MLIVTPKIATSDIVFEMLCDKWFQLLFQVKVCPMLNCGGYSILEVLKNRPR